jgi:hypothetical protein
VPLTLFSRQYLAITLSCAVPIEKKFQHDGACGRQLVDKIHSFSSSPTNSLENYMRNFASVGSTRGGLCESSCETAKVFGIVRPQMSFPLTQARRADKLLGNRPKFYCENFNENDRRRRSLA